MNGPEVAADRTAGWLKQRVPARLRIIEERYDLRANSLPNPGSVESNETGPIALEDWPAIYVLPQRLNGLLLVDVREDGSELYQADYAIRVLVWVRADTYESTSKLRFRYTLAVREALLERKQLAAPATYGSGDLGAPVSDIAVKPETIREDYSDVIKDANRTIAGTFLDLGILVAETLDGPAPLGNANTIDVQLEHDTGDLPPHPGL